MFSNHRSTLCLIAFGLPMLVACGGNSSGSKSGAPAATTVAGPATFITNAPFTETTTGEFTAVGEPSTTQPVGAFKACIEANARHETPAYDAKLKVGMKFVNARVLPIIGEATQTLNLKSTKTLTAVSPAHLEYTDANELGDSYTNSINMVCDINLDPKSEPAKFGKSECKLAKADPPVTPVTPDANSEFCDIDEKAPTAKKETSWSSGQYRFASGETVSAFREMEKITGPWTCRKRGGGAPVVRGTMTQIQIHIISRDILGLEASSCFGNPIFHYRGTRDEAGVLKEGFREETLEAPLK